MEEKSKSGGQGSPFTTLPYDVKIEFVKYLRVLDFLRLAATSKDLFGLWNDEAVWKYFLKRDFGASAVTQAELDPGDTKFKTSYVVHYVHKKEQERQRNYTLVYPPVSPYPPPGVIDPSSSHVPAPNVGPPGIIGGDYDLNPLGAFPPRPQYGNRPFGPQQLFQPFQPRIRPVTPFDPDAGLFGPRPPGRHRPGGPFGGGPHFPGGGFI